MSDLPLPPPPPQTSGDIFPGPSQPPPIPQPITEGNPGSPPTNPMSAALSKSVRTPGSTPQPNKPLPATPTPMAAPVQTQSAPATQQTTMQKVEKMTEKPWVRVLIAFAVVILLFMIFRMVSRMAEGLTIIPAIYTGTRPRPIVFDAQLM